MLAGTTAMDWMLLGSIPAEDMQGYLAYHQEWLVARKPMPMTLTKKEAKKRGLRWFGRGSYITCIFGIIFSVECRYCGNIWPASKVGCRCKTCAGDLE